MFWRAKNHSSNLAAQFAEKQRILQELKMNGCPIRRITAAKKLQQKRKERRVKSGSIQVSLFPTWKGLCQEAGKEMSNFWIPFKSHKIGNIKTHPKDLLPKEEQRGVVYKIKCKEHDGECIGETGRKLRDKEHKIIKQNRRRKNREKNKKKYTGGVTGHEIDWQSAEVMEKEEIWHRRKTKVS